MAVNALLHEPEPEERDEESGERHPQTNQILPGFPFIPEAEERNQQQARRESQANSGDQVLTRSTGFQKRAVWGLQ